MYVVYAVYVIPWCGRAAPAVRTYLIPSIHPEGVVCSIYITVIHQLYTSRGNTSCSNTWCGGAVWGRAYHGVVIPCSSSTRIYIPSTAVVDTP